MLCDAHTHWKKKMTDDGVIRVISLLTPEIPVDYNGLYSVGVHPMFAASSVIPSEYDGLFFGKNCCAIGECGLDRRAKLPMQEQVKLFLAHAEVCGTVRQTVGCPLCPGAERTFKTLS